MVAIEAGLSGAWHVTGCRIWSRCGGLGRSGEWGGQRVTGLDSGEGHVKSDWVERLYAVQ